MTGASSVDDARSQGSWERWYRVDVGRAEDRLSAALNRAGRLMEKSYGRRLYAKPFLSVDHRDGFLASVAPEGGTYRIFVSTGIVSALDALWAFLLDTPALNSRLDFNRSKAFNRLAGSVVGCSDLSMEWLCLHELMHIELGHMAFRPGAALVEVGAPDDSEATAGPELPEGFPADDAGLLFRCHEMQADCEASDIFLGPYAEGRWEELRVLAVCLFAVMALMERENTRLGSQNRTHPSAGTRFFTLLGHLFQMWLYPTATLEKIDIGSRLRTPERPDTDAFNAYAHAVLVPLINDAVMVAMAAEAHAFLDDIGGAGGLLQDIFTIQYADDLTEETLQTEAARGWLRLIPANELLMAAAGYRP